MVLGVVTALGVGAALWWWWSARAPRPEVPWTARVRVLAGDRHPLVEPFGVVAAADGTAYVSLGGLSPRIVVVSPGGEVRPLAGGTHGFADGRGQAARFASPSALALAEDGALVVADTGNNAIRRVSPSGEVTTLAGGGGAGFRDGPVATALFHGPIGVALDARGDVVVADTYNDRVRVFTPGGEVRTVAGGAHPGWQDGPGHEARFDTPSGVAVLPQGGVVVADTGNGMVRTIRPDGTVTTLRTAGVDLARPLDVAATSDGALLVTDEAGQVLLREAGGATRVLAGGRTGFADGLGPTAQFRRPAGVVVTGRREAVVADSGNGLLRLLTDPATPDRRPPVSPSFLPAFDADDFARVPLLWPVPPFDGPHEVAGTHGERRGGDGAERFHLGIDVRVPQDTAVHIVRPGVVSSPVSSGAFDTINEWVRVGEVSYVHIRAGRTRAGRLLDTGRFVPTYDADGTLRRLRLKRGARFATGDRVGSVNAFNHVHLSVGWPGDDHNPLHLRLLQFADSIPPTIAAGGIRVVGADGAPLESRTGGRLVVGGQVQIVVDAWDQADGNVPWRRLGLYELGYQVLHADGTPTPGFDHPRITQRYDRLGADRDAAQVVYAPGSGIPAYGNQRTRFLYVVTNRLEGGIATHDTWDTTTLAPGDYTVRIHAADIAGNLAVARRDLPVTVVRW